MKIQWDCKKVSKCDAYLYNVVMEGKKEYPNIYVGYKEGTPAGIYKTSIVKLEELFYADCLKYNPVMIIRETGSISEMKKRKPDFIIQLGDFSLPRKQNQPFIDKWNSFNGHKYHVLGNHDMKDFGFKKEETMKWLRKLVFTGIL